MSRKTNLKLGHSTKQVRDRSRKVVIAASLCYLNNT